MVSTGTAQIILLLCPAGPLFTIISMYENNFPTEQKNDKDIGDKRQTDKTIYFS